MIPANLLMAKEICFCRIYVKKVFFEINPDYYF